MSIDSDNKEEVVQRQYKLKEKRYDSNGEEIIPDDRAPAKFISRVAAFFIDTAILTVPYLVLNLFLLLIFGFTTHSILASTIEIAFSRFDLLETKTAVALTVFASIIAWIVITLIFGILYHSLLEIYMGASYGKKILGLKVVDSEGYEALPNKIIERNIYKIASLITFGSGFLVAMVSLRKETLHDMLSGTLVVRDLSVKKEQVIAGQCFGLAMAIGLYLIFINEQTTLEQLKPLLPSTELSDKISLNLKIDVETPEIPIAPPQAQQKLVDKLINSSAGKKSNSDEKDLESALDKVAAQGEGNIVEEKSNIAIGDVNSESDKKNNLVSALESVSKLKKKAIAEVGYIKIMDKRWNVNGAYARVDNTNQDSKNWPISLYFFENKLAVKDYSLLNKTFDPLIENPLKNNEILMSLSISYKNKSIICQRSDYTNGIIGVSKKLKEEVYKTIGIYPDSTLVIDDYNLEKQKIFKSSCLSTFMQSEVSANLNGKARISNDVYTELEWNFRFPTLLFEYLVKEKKFYKGTKNSFTLWNPNLNLLSIANLNEELTKEEIQSIYKAQNFEQVKHKVNVIILAEVDQSTVRLNTDSIKNGYKIIFLKNFKNGFNKQFTVYKGKYNLPKMLSGVLAQGSKIIGRFKGEQDFKNEHNEVIKLKWTIPVDSRVLLIK